MSNKTLFYLVESNRDYSVHCSSLKEALLITEAEFEDTLEEEPIEVNITQVWLIDEEIENMPEAD